MMGKPQALKQVNLSAVRKAIMDKGSATRSEIVEETGISVTTVRALLIEMEKAGEMEPIGQDQSSGGRKAVRYRMRMDKHYGVCVCITGGEVRWLTVNIGGEICETGALAGGPSNTEAIFALLDSLVNRLSINIIGIGVPGIPEGLEYVQKNLKHQMERFSIGRLVWERYGIPVRLENDLNAVAWGYARRHRNQSPGEARKEMHMAYLHFERGSLSAGLISGGQLLRGWKQYSGELGLFPIGDGTILDHVLDRPISDMEYAKAVAKVVSGVCCVLNPQHIVLAGSSFRKACLPLIEACYQHTLPLELTAELLYADDVWHDFMEGMAAITSEHIFSDVYIVQNTGE